MRLLQRKPDDHSKKNGYYRIEPDAVLMEKPLPSKTIVFRFYEQPVEEQEYEKYTPPTSKNGEDSSTTLAISDMRSKSQ